MKKHELKILPEYFYAVLNREKLFEFRKNDRAYKLGDLIILREWDGSSYTGRFTSPFQITFILSEFEGLEPGYVVLGLRDYVRPNSRPNNEKRESTENPSTP
ncbi:MAG: DUF3850 domain-containing protein [Candidatus Electrothrix sp. AUS1_2]|nr:DUF3850 domain-containing protein [Candidatus Electrothrix sp. AUS1_2]